jgi:signal recognition particle receptor subunit beta
MADVEGTETVQEVSATSEGTSNSAAMLAAVAVVIATMVFLYLRSDREDSSVSSIAAGTTKHKVNGVVLLGPSGSGKTVILHQLSSGTTVETLPSMTASYNQVSVEGSDILQVVDFPGHERLRASMLQHVKGAKGVVFVLDATATKSIKQAALLLFQLLTSSEFKTSTPLLVRSTPCLACICVASNRSLILIIYWCAFSKVFCNKADQKEAKGSERVKLLLQKEIDGMRKTSGKMAVSGGDNDADVLAASGDSDANSGALEGFSDSGKPFKFDNNESVTFASGSALDKGASGGLTAVVDFLRAY